MKKLGVIGNPISHSLSPAMHNAVLKHFSLDTEYVAIKLEEHELPNFIEKARREYLGFNVTVPYKTAIIPFLDAVDEECFLSQSVNTVVTDERGKLIGKSTDGYGLEKALEEAFGVSLKDTNIMFVGCGGAAKAAAVYCLKKKIKSIFFANRTVENATEFVGQLKERYPESEIDYSSLNDHNKINKFLDLKPIIVQSTSLGLKDRDPSPFPADLFRPELRVFDMIYKKTNFLCLAKEKGCICADGRLMLLYQGAKSFSIWTKLEPPVEVMKKVLFA